MTTSSWLGVFGLVFWLVNSVCAAEAGPPSGTSIQFDAIVELNAPLCQAHVVLFVRYWVSPRFYRAAVVWVEPHEGSLNFPGYPPTLSVASDPNAFTVSHQFRRTYDYVFRKPPEPRGPFRHRFNAYSLGDMRFAEKEALGVRVYSDDLKRLVRENGEHERILDIAGSGDDRHGPRDFARIRAQTSRGRLDELQLLDPNGQLLKSIDYEYASGDGNSTPLREGVLLPERPITVGFGGAGPLITISGEAHRYSEMETIQHQGGRRCVVDYGVQKMGDRTFSLPVRVVVYSGDGSQVLRSARLCNFAAYPGTAEEIAAEMKRYSGFDENDLSCREMFLKYWMKDPRQVASADTNTVRQLWTHFAHEPIPDATIGQQLKRANSLVQLDWILGDPNRLEQDFRAYVSLLSANKLDRMILFGGRNIVETTARWGQQDAADRLLRLWLESGVSRNNVAAILDFADGSVRQGHLWVATELMGRLLGDSRLSSGDRFVAQGTRCLALARIYQTREAPDPGATDLATVQKGWAMAHLGGEGLRAQTRESAKAAKETFGTLTKPTREQQAIQRQLDTIARTVFGDGSRKDESQESEHVNAP